MIKIILLFFSASGVKANSTPPSQFFISEPQSLTSVAGSSLTLPCLVGSKQGVCQWTRDGLGLGVDLELSAYPRLSMSEDSCDLHIYPLLPSDEGAYECQVGAVPGVAPIASSPAVLTVSAEPGQPHITQAALGDVMEVERGEEVVLECQSLGGRPAAEISWTDQAGQIMEDQVKTTIVSMKDGKTFKTVSILKFEPVTDTEISCSAKNRVFPEPKTSAIVIKHLQKPNIYLSLESPRIMAGDSFDITCSTKAYPDSVRYKWYVNGQRLFNEESSTLRINKISKSSDKVEVNCQATNKVGSDEAAIVLDVEHGPVITEEPKDILAKTGDAVTLTCVAEANPAPTYVWIKQSTREVVGFDSDLTLTAGKVDEEFLCKVFSGGFDEIESNPAKLQIIRKPEIKSLDEGEINGEHLLHCSVESVAKKTKITWIVNDDPIDISDADYETIYNEDGIFHQSFLVFKQKDQKYLGHTCSVSNEAGTDYKVAPNTSSHTDSLAICILVIMLLTVIIIISFTFIIYNRQKNSSTEKMEKEKDIKKLSSEAQPCLDRSLWLDQSFISPSSSLDSCNTFSTTLARSFSLDQSRTERMMGL